MDLTFEQTQCKNFNMFKFWIPHANHMNKQKTKVVAICRLMDEDDFGVFVDDQEELHVKEEDLEELHAKNEKKHAD